MIFFFCGRPSALLRYQMSLTCVSLASEPELQKNTFEIGTGAISLSFSASSIAGSWLRPMNKGELAHLVGGDFDELLIAVAERGAPESGHAFDIGLTSSVVDIDAARTFNNKRPALTKAGEIDVRMHQRFDVAGGKITQRRHSGLLYVRDYGAGLFFSRLLVRFAVLGRGRGSGTSSGRISPACSPALSDAGGWPCACATGGSRMSHWQSL